MKRNLVGLFLSLLHMLVTGWLIVEDDVHDRARGKRSCSLSSQRFLLFLFAPLLTWFVWCTTSIMFSPLDRLLERVDANEIPFWETTLVRRKRWSWLNMSFQSNTWSLQSTQSSISASEGLSNSFLSLICSGVTCGTLSPCSRSYWQRVAHRAEKAPTTVPRAFFISTEGRW